MIFHYGMKLWRADKEVQMLAALIVCLMVLSITLKILVMTIVNPFQWIGMINFLPHRSQSPSYEVEPVQMPCEAPIVIEEPPMPPAAEEPQQIKITVETPETTETETIDIVPPAENEAQYMKLCLKCNPKTDPVPKVKKAKCDNPNEDPVKTIKMTLCNGKGKTLFEESTNFHVTEGDGVLPTIILTTAPIPIDNY